MSKSPLSVLITGSNQGLGFHAALHLSKRKDIHLIISGRDASRVKDALDSITSAEGCQASVDSVLIDVSDDESINTGVKEVEKKLNGRALDVLVNNSALFLDGEIPTLGLRKVFEQCYAVNVFGASITAEAFLPLLKKSKATEGPKILNISSGLGSNTLVSDPNGPTAGHYYTVYNSSKSALNSITTTLAMKNRDVHVVSIDPGHNATNLNKYSAAIDPKDGSVVIVDHVLKKIGKSPSFWSAKEEYQW